MLLWVYAEMLMQSYDYAISYFNHNFHSSDADASYINMSLVKNMQIQVENLSLNVTMAAKVQMN